MPENTVLTRRIIHLNRECENNIPTPVDGAIPLDGNGSIPITTSHSFAGVENLQTRTELNMSGIINEINEINLISGLQASIVVDSDFARSMHTHMGTYERYRRDATNARHTPEIGGFVYQSFTGASQTSPGNSTNFVKLTHRYIRLSNGRIISNIDPRNNYMTDGNKRLLNGAYEYLGDIVDSSDDIVKILIPGDIIYYKGGVCIEFTGTREDIEQSIGRPAYTVNFGKDIYFSNIPIRSKILGILSQGPISDDAYIFNHIYRFDDDRISFPEIDFQRRN